MTLARRCAAAVVLALAALVAACAQPAPAPEPEAAQVTKEAESWRAKHEADYRRDWVTIAGLHFLQEGAQSAGSDKSNDIVLPASAPATLSAPGYYGAGRIPIRKTGDGSVPYDGTKDDGEWTGFIPFDKLPHVYDPPSGIIVTANQRVAGSDYPYFLSHAWATPYRARRIYDLLSEKPKLSPDDFRRIQTDIYSIGNVTFARGAAKILKTANSDGKTTPLISDLETWDGLMSADSRMAVIISQMRVAFRQRIFSYALGPETAKTFVWPESDVLMDRLIQEQPKEWLPKEFASYADLLRASYDDARQALTKALGADETKWNWGGQAKARYTHPLAAAPLIGLQFTIPPIPQNGTGGSGATVNVGGGVSMRWIADPSDWDKTMSAIPLGASGWPNSPHWKDQLEGWLKGVVPPLPFTKAAVETAAKETIVLEPAK